MKTLKELKDFLNSLSDDQLNGAITVMGNIDEGLMPVTVTGFDTLAEDYFVTDEGICPVSTHDPEVNEPLEECEIIDKGTVFFYQD